jgi:hypothetical protein
MDCLELSGTVNGESKRVTWRSPSRGAWSTGLAAAAVFVIAVIAALLGGGCAGVPTLWPNSDPALRHTAAEFAADGAKRHPFKSDAPSGGEAAARANVDYGLDIIQIANLSDEEWHDVDLWVNQNWVVHLSKVEKSAQVAKTINFRMLYDDQGHTYTWNQKPETRIHQLELYKDGKMYTVKLALAD